MARTDAARTDAARTDAARTDVARLRAVRRYEVLDAPPDGAFDEYAALAAKVCGTPISTVSIVDADRVWFAATYGPTEAGRIGDEPGLCASAFLADGPYLADDAVVDPRTMDHPQVRSRLGLRFYAAAPIVTSDGHRLGTIAVIDHRVRTLSAVQYGTLRRLATLIAQQLDLRLAAILAVRAEQHLRDDTGPAVTASPKLAEELRRAAARQRRCPPPATCQLGRSDEPCPDPAEIKVADSWGDAAWGCPAHVEEAVLKVPSAFVADEELSGLTAYLSRR